MEPSAYIELHTLEPDHWWYAGMRLITGVLLANVIGDRHDLAVLDAGCGVGGGMSQLARFGQVYGCDYSSLALGFAREQHPQRIVQATVEYLPYKDQSFDLVTSFDVLYCREVASDARALTEFARVLVPRGYLLLRLPALNALAGQHDSIVHGVRRYTHHDMHHKLQEAGFTPLRITYANSLLLPIIYLVRRLQHLSKSAEPPTQSDVRPTAKPINQLLYRLLAVEAAWLRHGYNLPLGVSVIALAQKAEI